jgi:iron complex transport system substrate-binding protein
MSGLRKAFYFVFAIIVIDLVGCLISVYLPAIQATFKKTSETADPAKMRIVSLSPGVTEMLFVLGVGDSIVGATDYCNYPPEAKRIERVGSLGKPNVEKLLALSPDLVVASGMERNDVLQMLRKSDIRVLKIKIENIDQMFDALRQLGDAVGKRPRADEAIASMQTELKSVALQTEKSRRGPPPHVFVELWDDPLTTIGGTSFLDDVIARAGGVNAAHEISQPHPRISAEKVIEWDPDFIVVAHMARTPGAAEEIGKRIGWSDMKAVKQGRIIRDIPSDLILRPGPRLVDAVKVLAERLRDKPSSLKDNKNP